METKICKKCGKEKSISDFFRIGKRRSCCKVCRREQQSLYYKKNKGKILICAKNYYKIHKERCIHCNKIYRKTDEGKKVIQESYKKRQDIGYFTYRNGYIWRLRASAKKRKLSFNLTKESLKKWWKESDNCAYCGINTEQYLKIRDFILSYRGTNYEINKFKGFYCNPKYKKIQQLTIDRIRNDKGYELNNIVKACWICNSLKGHFFSGVQMKLIGLDVISKLINEINQINQISNLNHLKPPDFTLDFQNS
jgi:hypothetical protein